MASLLPVVTEGEYIELVWEFEKVTCLVKKVKKCEDIKKGSNFKYVLLNLSTNEEIKTRLIHLEYKKISNPNKESVLSQKRSNASIPSISSTANISPTVKKSKHIFTSTLPIHKYILAPMVGASELPFRLLCRRYGAQLAYTPMISSERFAVDEEYRKIEFQTTPEDRPLVAHFSANNPRTFLAAAKLVESQCDAIDLNLGCPQRVAFTGHFGSYLLDDSDRALVIDMVKTVSRGIQIPLFVKIRLLDKIQDSERLCFQLAEAGTALIAIHARYRVNLVGRSGPGARDGPAHLDQVRAIKEAFLRSKFAHIPIISNGNVITYSDVKDNLKTTAADGIMSAEGLLDDPALFFDSVHTTSNKSTNSSSSSNSLSDAGVMSERMSATSTTSTSKTNNIRSTKPSKVQLALEYINLVTRYPATLKTVIFHIRRMCKDELTKYELLEECLSATSLTVVREVVNKMIKYETEGGFELDQEKIRKANEAIARMKREENKRKEFEARMIRKAKRESKPLDHYLKIGAILPSVQRLIEMRCMTKDESFQEWKQHHSQHCYAFHIFHHVGAKQCDRDRTCAFLHMDAVYEDDKEVFG